MLNLSGALIGAGNFGIAVEYNNYAIKLLYDLNSHKELQLEGSLQKEAYKLLKNIPIIVPKIYDVFTFPYLQNYRNETYLCGLIMDRVPNPEGFIDFEEATNFSKDYIGPVHMLLGYDQDDIDTIWGKQIGLLVSKENPPRGFHAGPEMLEAIWEDESSRHNLTIEKVAYIMGKSISVLIDGGIIPLDLEWIYGGNGEIWLIDFGLCEFGKVNKTRFLHEKSSRSIYANYYVPREGMRGYSEFLEGYWSSGATS